jgi:MarR family transcriptional regulator, organic hydroperoxide resistance regulator
MSGSQTKAQPRPRVGSLLQSETQTAPEGKQAIDRIVETAIFLQAESRRLAREACARHGITATQLNVLKLLEGIGELSLSELSRHLAARNSTVTGIIDRMVGAELVAREQSAEDRRVWRIRATDKGRAIAARIDVAPWDLLRSALTALPPDEQQTLISTLTKIAAHVREEVAATQSRAAT